MKIKNVITRLKLSIPVLTLCIIVVFSSNFTFAEEGTKLPGGASPGAQTTTTTTGKSEDEIREANRTSFATETDKLNQPVNVSLLPGPTGTLTDVFNLIIRILAGIVASVVLFRIISSAFKAISGKEQDVTDRNTIILNSVIGLVIVLLSGMIASGVLSFFYASGTRAGGTSGGTVISAMSWDRTKNPALNTFMSSSAYGNFTKSLTLVNKSVGLSDAAGDPGIPNATYGTHLITCTQVIYFKRIDPEVFNNKEFRAAYFPLLNKCGQQSISDLAMVVKQILSFLYDILGTLMVIALMIAGFMYIFDSKKDAAEGKKRLQGVFTGALVALLAAPLLQFGLAAIIQILN